MELGYYWARWKHVDLLGNFTGELAEWELVRVSEYEGKFCVNAIEPIDDYELESYEFGEKIEQRS